MSVDADDGALELRARRGDPTAFGTLLRRYDHDLRGVAWSVVRSSDAVDDIMQSSYEKAFRSIDGFDGRSTLKTWLHSVVHRTAIDHLRREVRRHHDDLSAAASAATPDGASLGAMGRIELAEVLDGLRPEQRVALMLTAGLGYSFDEAAQIMGERRGTVASRVSRARRRIERWEVS